MTRIVPRRYTDSFGPIVGGSLSLIGAIGGVVALAASHLGVVLYTGTRVFAAQQEYVYHATADASLASVGLFAMGFLATMIAAGLWSIGTRLLDEHAETTYYESDSVNRDVLFVGEIVAILGPSSVGVAGVLAFGVDWILLSLLSALVVYCIGLAVIFRAVRPAIHPDRSPV